MLSARGCLLCNDRVALRSFALGSGASAQSGLALLEGVLLPFGDDQEGALGIPVIPLYAR